VGGGGKGLGIWESSGVTDFEEYILPHLYPLKIHRVKESLPVTSFI